jgi:MarR family transcriptional regulator, transcriptional regulator for hemolysin
MYRPYVNAKNFHLAKHQLFSSQFRILRLLADKGPLTFAVIANEIHVEKPSASGLIRKLQELGYVETKQGKDKREKYVQLTQEGEIVHQEVEETIGVFLESALEGIPQEEQEIANSVLERILQNLTR